MTELSQILYLKLFSLHASERVAAAKHRARTLRVTVLRMLMGVETRCSTERVWLSSLCTRRSLSSCSIPLRVYNVYSLILPDCLWLYIYYSIYKVCLYAFALSLLLLCTIAIASSRSCGARELLWKLLNGPLSHLNAYCKWCGGRSMHKGKLMRSLGTIKSRLRGEPREWIQRGSMLVKESSDFETGSKLKSEK